MKDVEVKPFTEENEAKIQKFSKVNLLLDERENQFVRMNIMRKPSGYVIMDSYNNPFFPIKDIIIDNSDFNVDFLQEKFHFYYGGKPKDLFLPFHYVINNVNGIPFVINTRPFNYKNIIPDYENKISIMIVGDSNKDLYTAEFYKKLAHFTINPFRFLNGFYLLNQRKDFEFLTGKNFDTQMLFKYIF